MPRRGHSVRACGLALSAVWTVSPASAQTFVVPDGTVSDEQVMRNDYDRGLVEAGGEISAFIGYAVSMTGDGQLLDNRGSIGFSSGGFGGSYAVYSTGADVWIENSGEIDATIGSTGTSATIRNRGILDPAGALNGIESSGADAFIVNEGEILVNGTNSFGISSTGDAAFISNSGSISTGVGAGGILSAGAQVRIFNSGAIAVDGGGGHGIESIGADVLIENVGTVSTSGISALGVFAVGSASVVNNTGTIATSGDLSDGIYATGANSRIANSGRIETQGESAEGIYSSGAGTEIYNAGTISVAADVTAGVMSVGPGGWITNSGTIRATGAGAFSIAIGGAGTHLNVMPGSVIEGDMFWRAAEAASGVLDIAPGLSAALHFLADDGFGDAGALPGTVLASGMPLVVDAGAMTVMTADVTAVRAEAQALGDLTGGVFGAIATRGAAGTMSAPLAYAPDAAPHTRIFDAREPYARTVWLRGFGGGRDQNASNISVGYDSRLAGFVSGMDLVASEAGTAGLFLGAGWAKTQVPLSQDVETQSAFGGAYGTFAFGSATLDLGLVLGWSDYDSTRRVADMGAPGGLAEAEADYSGIFVSQQIGIMQPVHVGGQRIEARGSVRYAGLFIDGYEESGPSSANLRLDERDLHLLVGRTSLSVPVEYAHADGSQTRLIPGIGLEGRTQIGDGTVSGTLGGGGIAFDTSEGESIGAFVGFRAEHETAGNFTLFAEAEGLIEDGGSARALAKGGIAARF